MINLSDLLLSTRLDSLWYYHIKFFQCCVEDPEIKTFKQCIMQNKWGQYKETHPHKSVKDTFTIKEPLVLKKNTTKIAEQGNILDP